MKSKAKILAVGTIFILFALFSFACQSNHGTTPIAPTVITRYFDGTFHFKPSAVTITSGSSVIWDGSFGCFHTLNIDNGASNCVTDYTCYPVTIAFNSPGNFNFHCDYHSSCGSGTCANCTGMVGNVLVK
jgi:plastocyanin